MTLADSLTPLLTLLYISQGYIHLQGSDPNQFEKSQKSETHFKLRLIRSQFEILSYLKSTFSENEFKSSHICLYFLQTCLKLVTLFLALSNTFLGHTRLVLVDRISLILHVNYVHMVPTENFLVSGFEHAAHHRESQVP